LLGSLDALLAEVAGADGNGVAVPARLGNRDFPGPQGAGFVPDRDGDVIGLRRDADFDVFSSRGGGVQHNAQAHPLRHRCGRFPTLA
jgi:hypothetical protein